MGWYDKGLQINPGLVALTGGVGRGMAAFGKSLVNLGDKKVARAEKQAALDDKKAKRAVQAKYNKAINPNLANKIGDKGLGRISFSAPTDKRKTISAGETVLDGNNNVVYKAPAKKKYKVVGGNLLDLNTMKPVYSAPKTQKKQNPITKDMRGKDGRSYVFKYDRNTKKFVNTGHLSTWQGNQQGGSNKSNFVPIGSLSPQDKQLASNFQIRAMDKNMHVVVDKNVLEKLKQKANSNMSKKKNLSLGEERGY